MIILFEFVGHIKHLLNDIIERDIAKLFHCDIVCHLEYEVLSFHNLDWLACVR